MKIPRKVYAIEEQVELCHYVAKEFRKNPHSKVKGKLFWEEFRRKTGSPKSTDSLITHACRQIDNAEKLSKTPLDVHTMLYLFESLELRVSREVKRSCGSIVLARHYNSINFQGDYEICLFAPRPVRILLNIFFHHPEKVEKSFQLYLVANQMNTDIQKLFSTLFQNLYKMKYAIKFYNQITVRDEATQEMNSEYIKGYATVFSAVAILLALVQVTLVRRMFRVDVSRIRI